VHASPHDGVKETKGDQHKDEKDEDLYHDDGFIDQIARRRQRSFLLVRSFSYYRGRRPRQPTVATSQQQLKTSTADENKPFVSLLFCRKDSFDNDGPWHATHVWLDPRSDHAKFKKLVGL